MGWFTVSSGPSVGSSLGRWACPAEVWAGLGIVLLLLRPPPEGSASVSEQHSPGPPASLEPHHRPGSSRAQKASRAGLPSSLPTSAPGTR